MTRFLTVLLIAAIPWPACLSGETPKYDRSLFDEWADEDQDCLNTRHELLIEISTSTVQAGTNTCTVIWNDPYTGKIFFDAKQMGIDHLVYLKWA